MVKGNSFVMYRSEKSNDMTLLCYITRHSVSTVLYDSGFSGRYARAVSYGKTMTAADSAEEIARCIQRVMRESGTPFNTVRRVGFAAPADITMLLEEQVAPVDLFLPPDTQMLIMPIINTALGGDFSAVLASALAYGRNVLSADCTGGLRLACVSDRKLKFANAAMAGGFDGTALESGMPLENGAVSSLSREPDGAVVYSVIGDEAAAGISVPAALMTLKLMLDSGTVDSDGIMTDRDLFFIGEDLYISQSDVRAMQFDKAVLRSALELFGEAVGRSDCVIFSGEAFGSEHGAAMAEKLSSVPDGLAEKYGWARRPGENGLLRCINSPELFSFMQELCGSAEDITDRIQGRFDDLYIKYLGFDVKL